MYDRKSENSVKQLSFNYKNKQMNNNKKTLEVMRHEPSPKGHILVWEPWGRIRPSAPVSSPVKWV